METVEIVNEADDLGFVMPRKANDVIAEAMLQKPLPPLFDGFWRTGELALMFGAAGIGKSLLAVRLAEALARGRPLAGFNMPRRRHKVLYVDLMLSDVQFQRRYTATDITAKPYKFAERLYRARPRHDEDISSWVRKMVRLGGFEVVIIDDLSALMRTDDGTFDTLRIMRKLKQLSHETGVSVLVLADSMPSPRNNDIGESDLRRSRVLCGVADSVFGIGRWERGNLKLVQFRSQGNEVVWGSLNPIGCAIARDENGLLGFVFDARFAPKLDPERCALICRVNKLWGAGLTFRVIADELRISNSRASRLFHAWTPAAYKLVYGTDCLNETERYGYDEDNLPDHLKTDEYQDGDAAHDTIDDAIDVTPASVTKVENVPWYERIYPANIPFAAALGRRSILDLEHDVDGYGRAIFVESREEYTGKPLLWYQCGNDGRYRRSKRGPFCVIHTTLGTSHYIQELRE